ncbi:hypothetical protein HIM_11215 [Hirsutella minnesotensis 3608]|uniref:Methyltransferase domain-containing protein n=1 Tax=Hirsutella minnesotensis 3608 TaxID=1043627 RepID=A0A0F8A1F9_9HYPO|nr:hypothetical protein HIM_11215 [Hirsutella minnesotensis 3608]
MFSNSPSQPSQGPRPLPKEQNGSRSTGVADEPLDEGLWMRGAGKGDNRKYHQKRSGRDGPPTTPPPCGTASQLPITRCPKSFDIHAMALSFTVDARSLSDAEMEAAGVKRPIVQGRASGMDEPPEFTAEEEFTQLWKNETKESGTMESMGGSDAAELDKLRSTISKHVRSPLPRVLERHITMAVGHPKGPDIYTVGNMADPIIASGSTVDAEVSLVDDLATPFSISDEPALRDSSNGAGSDSPHDDPTSQYGPLCKYAVGSNPDLTRGDCKQPPAGDADIAPLAMDALTGAAVYAETYLADEPATPCSWGDEPSLETSSSGTSFQHAEASETDGYTLEHQSGRNQEGSRTHISDTVDISNPPTNVNTPRLGTPDTHWCEAAQLESKHVNGDHLHYCAHDTFSSIDTWSRRIFEALRDEHSPGRVERTGPSGNDQEKPGVKYSRIAGPKSDTSDSLPDTAIPSDMSDDASSDSSDIRILNPNQTTAAVSCSITEMQGSGDVADDADSTFGEEPPSSTASLSSSIKKHEWKNGRRYHSYRAGLYCFPNDDREQNRLDMLHHVFLLALDDRLFLAPIGLNPNRILDVGAGTGIWAIDVGDQYPSAVVRGYDLSPIQPQDLPPNVEFLVDDVEQECFESAEYDFVHLRNLLGSIANWPRLVELQGILNQPYSEDGTLSSDDPVVQLMDGLKRVGDKRGRDMDPASSFKRWAESTGFVSVQERRFSLPVGDWPKDPKLREIGIFMAESLREGIEGLTAVPFREVLGWSQDEVHVLNATVRRTVRRRDIHLVFDYVVVTGMKPMTGY